MKGRNYFYWISIFSLIFSFLVRLVVANPVGVPTPLESPIFRTIVIVIMFIIAVCIEYLIIIKSKINKDFREDNLFLIVLIINLITIPPVQLLAYAEFIYLSSFFWLYVFGLEVLIIILEWLLLTTAVKKRYSRILPPIYSLFIVIIANVASFLLGLVPFFNIQFLLY